ncbi:Translocation and assembly module subunit TamA [Candidatus Electronema halotolerans]
MPPLVRIAALLAAAASLFLPAYAAAAPVSITVLGVNKPELQQNIFASLKIAQQQDAADLSTGRIRLLHKQAPEQIKAALAPFGYYSVQIKNDNGHGLLKKNGANWQAEYVVELGPPTKVAALKIEVTGPGSKAKTLQEQVLQKSFPLQPGSQLDDGKYEAGKKGILQTALEAGYVRARFTESRVEVRAKEQKAAVMLRLDTGPLYVFGKTSSSMYILKPELLQRYLPYQTGEVYSFKALNQLQSDLYGTGYFSKVTVEPQLPPPEDAREEVPVELHLQPALKNRWSFGLGYGTDTGARGSIGWKNRMINRRGHRASLNAQLAEKGSKAAADYEIPVPILDLRYDSLNFDTQYSEESWANTDIRQFTLGASVKHNAPNYQFGTGLEYLHETYTVSGKDDSTYLLMPNAFLTLIFAESRVKTDNGLRITGSVRGAQAPLLASTSFFQFRVGGKVILSPWDKWRFIGRGSFGATAMESINELPPSLRFYAGGDQSVRGYGYKQLGPKDDSGRVVGGQYLTEASAELERKLFSIWSAAVFYDIGNAYDNIDARLQQGVGVGVRMTLPFGQLRLDFAEALSEPGFSLRIHLTLGADL